jgi:hypothetical protein
MEPLGVTRIVEGQKVKTIISGFNKILSYPNLDIQLHHIEYDGLLSSFQASYLISQLARMSGNYFWDGMYKGDYIQNELNDVMINTNKIYVNYTKLPKKDRKEQIKLIDLHIKNQITILRLADHAKMVNDSNSINKFELIKKFESIKKFENHNNSISYYKGSQETYVASEVPRGMEETYLHICDNNYFSSHHESPSISQEETSGNVLCYNKEIGSSTVNLSSNIYHDTNYQQQVMEKNLINLPFQATEHLNLCLFTSSNPITIIRNFYVILLWCISSFNLERICKFILIQDIDYFIF